MPSTKSNFDAFNEAIEEAYGLGKDNTCPKCGGELIIGSYPFCKGNPSDHETVRTRVAQSIQGTVYFENAKGEISFPTNAKAPIPAGYVKKELTTLQAADRFMREQNVRERIRAEEATSHERRYWKEVYRQGAQHLEDRLKRGLFTGDRAVYAEDAIRKMRNYEGKKTQDPGFYIEPLAYDSSNRESYCDESTGWKERKD